MIIIFDYPPGGCRVVFFWHYVGFAFVLISSFLLSSKPNPSFNRSSIITCAPAATRRHLTTVYVRFHLFLFFASGEVSLFPIFLYHCRFIFCMESTLYVFLPGGAFLFCDHGLDFHISSCENSIRFDQIQSTPSYSIITWHI